MEQYSCKINNTKSFLIRGILLEEFLFEFVTREYEIERTKSVDEMVQFISSDI